MAVSDIVAGNFIIASELREALTPEWAAYVPTWSSSGTQPVLNNGTISGLYLTFGKFAFYSVELVMGSTTTYGTGEYRFDVPVTAASFVQHVGAAFLYDDSSASARRSGVVRFLNATTLLLYAQNGEASSTVPFTWATNDRIRFTITYEIA